CLFVSPPTSHQPTAPSPRAPPSPEHRAPVNEHVSIRRRRAGATAGAHRSVRRAGIEDADLYGRTSAAGWQASGLSALMYALQRANVESQAIDVFLAELDGRPLATAALVIEGGVALLAGASTIPEGR